MIVALPGLFSYLFFVIVALPGLFSYLFCDICQRTIKMGRVTKVPLGKLPLTNTPFKRVADDIVRPIKPRSDKKSRYIITVIDYATRYPEVVALLIVLSMSHGKTLFCLALNFK